MVSECRDGKKEEKENLRWTKGAEKRKREKKESGEEKAHYPISLIMGEKDLWGGRGEGGEKGIDKRKSRPIRLLYFFLTLWGKEDMAQN